MKARNPHKECRWSLPAMVLLQASCGAMVTKTTAIAASPIYKELASTDGAEQKAAEALYNEALQNLEDRGFGVQKDTQVGRVLLKRHYTSLPESSRKLLTDAGIHVLSRVAYSICVWKQKRQGCASEPATCTTAKGGIPRPGGQTAVRASSKSAVFSDD